MSTPCALLAAATFVIGYVSGMLITHANSQPQDQVIRPTNPTYFTYQPTQPQPPPQQPSYEDQLRNHLREQELKNKLIQQQWQQRLFEEGINRLNQPCDSHRRSIGMCQ